MSRLKLDDVEWDSFYVYDIFDIYERGRRLKIEERQNGSFPFITAGETNNGISSFINNENHKEFEKAITIDMFGNAFYQDNKFKCDDNITILKNNNFSKDIYLFLTTRLNILKEKYSYGNQIRPNRLSRDRIMLPIDANGEPNWQFMEDYIKQEMKEQSQKVVKYYENQLLKLEFDLLDLEVEWKEFFFTDIFKEVKRGKRLTKNNQIDGNIPYVSSTSINNGVDNFIGNEDNVRFYEKNLSLANSGSVGSCFYHKYKYIASDHITSLTSEYADEYIYKFMATIIKRIEEKYSFNREINDARISREKILLPIDDKGNPNWEYMRLFIKKIEKENILKALNYYKNNYLTHRGGGKVKWREYFIEDICDIKSGKDIYEKERISGKTPYITATSLNNGIGYFVDNTNLTLESGCISVNRNGSVGYSFYHKYKALFGNDTRKLVPKIKNEYIGKFISFMISIQKSKYGYGYKMGTGRLKRQKILLPSKKDGSIDFDFMKKYIITKEIEEILKIIRFYKAS